MAKKENDEQGNTTINMYGGIYIRNIEHVEHLHPMPEPQESPAPRQQPFDLPPELATEQAMVYWQRLQEHGFVDEHYQPLGSRTEMAVVAYTFASHLKLENTWVNFEKLWQKRYLRNDYDAAQEQRKTLELYDRLKSVFAD